MADKQQRRYWLDEPRNIDRLVHGLWVLCGLAVIAEFFYVKHSHFGFDGWFGFFAGFGFVAYCVIVLTAKQLRRLVARDEDYYADGSDLSNATDDAGPAGNGHHHDG